MTRASGFFFASWGSSHRCWRRGDRERRLGVGFAVAIARAIVLMHGGDAEVVSAAERTVYSISLPR